MGAMSEGGGSPQRSPTTTSATSADSRNVTAVKGKKSLDKRQSPPRFYILLEELANEHERAIALLSGKLEITRGALDKLRNEPSDAIRDVFSLSSGPEEEE